MAEIPDRRGPVIGFALLAWLVAAGPASRSASRGRLARPGVRIAGLAVVYLPLVLLLGAALEPSQGVEQLLVAVRRAAARRRDPGGAAAATGRWPSPAALTVIAYAVDVVAGSPLTSLSLLGPNPGLGVRFYGIGNELEALLAVLVVAGTGAALTGFAPRASRRAPSRRVFLATGLRLRLRLRRRPLRRRRRRRDRPAARRRGRRRDARRRAGAAPCCSRSPRRSRPSPCSPLVDLVSGADAHLTRSVLDAGGLDELAEVAQRRLQLSAHSFARPIVYVFLPLLAAVAALAFVWRDRIAAWLAGRPAMRAGLAGAAGGDPARHPGQRLRRAPARDRHRLSARLRRLRLGRGGRPTRPLPLVASCASRLSRHIPGPIRAA